MFPSEPTEDFPVETVGVDPETDMAVVCPNCHRMLHRGKDGPLTIGELIEVLRNRGMLTA